MNQFFTSLFSWSEFIGLESPVLKLTAGDDVSADSIMFFKTYKSSEWPEITTSKDYFFIWSTDHDSGDGGIWWGEADDPSLTNFVELGLIITGHQAETPFLYRVPISKSGLGAGEEIFLYYHTTVTEPGNSGIQQTRLITTTGGLLHTATWNDRGRPIPITEPTPHTGYMKIVGIKGNGDYIAAHLAGDGTAGATAFSTSSDGLTYTFDRYYNNETGMPSGRISVLPHNTYFELGGVQYCLGSNRDAVPAAGGAPIDRIALFRCDGDYQVTEHLIDLTDTEQRVHMAYIENGVAHITYQNPKRRMFYTTWAIQNAGRV